MKELLEYLKYSKELTINPFGLGKASCNNRCKFCVVSDRLLNNDVPLDYFIQTTNNTKKWLLKYIDILPEDISISFFFVAGELFYMDKNYFNLYNKIAKELFDIVSKKYKNIRFIIQSNILSHNKDTINNLVNLIKSIKKLSNNTTFTTSFDMYSRFNNNTLETWKDNLFYVQKSINDKVMIEMILLEPSIKHYLTENDNLTQTFDEILSDQDKFDLSLEDFILNDLNNINLYPITEDLINFYKKINNKFPNHPVLYLYKNLKKSKESSTVPRGECILIQFSDKPFNNGIIHTDDDLRIVNDNCLGGILSNLLKYPIENIISFIPKVNKGLYCISNHEEVVSYFNKKCSFCKYKPYCTPKCFIQNLIKYKPQECQTKLLFEEFNKNE